LTRAHFALPSCVLGPLDLAPLMRACSDREFFACDMRDLLKKKAPGFRPGAFAGALRSTTGLYGGVKNFRASRKPSRLEVIGKMGEKIFSFFGNGFLEGAGFWGCGVECTRAVLRAAGGRGD